MLSKYLVRIFFRLNVVRLYVNNKSLHFLHLGRVICGERLKPINPCIKIVAFHEEATYWRASRNPTLGLSNFLVFVCCWVFSFFEVSNDIITFIPRCHLGFCKWAHPILLLKCLGLGLNFRPKTNF